MIGGAFRGRAVREVTRVTTQPVRWGETASRTPEVETETGVSDSAEAGVPARGGV